MPEGHPVAGREALSPVSGLLEIPCHSPIVVCADPSVYVAGQETLCRVFEHCLETGVKGGEPPCSYGLPYPLNTHLISPPHQNAVLVLAYRKFRYTPSAVLR